MKFTHIGYRRCDHDTHVYVQDTDHCPAKLPLQVPSAFVGNTSCYVHENDYIRIIAHVIVDLYPMDISG